MKLTPGTKKFAVLSIIANSGEHGIQPKNVIEAVFFASDRARNELAPSEAFASGCYHALADLRGAGLVRKLGNLRYQVTTHGAAVLAASTPLAHPAPKLSAFSGIIHDHRNQIASALGVNYDSVEITIRA